MYQQYMWHNIMQCIRDFVYDNKTIVLYMYILVDVDGQTKLQITSITDFIKMRWILILICKMSMG